MDVFVEQLVKKPADGKTLALKILIVFGIVIVSSFCLYLTFLGIVIALLLVFAAVYGGIYLISGHRHQRRDRHRQDNRTAQEKAPYHRKAVKV